MALLYPNRYEIAVSNLGWQLVYSGFNRNDQIVCERFVYPPSGQPLRSLESGRPLTDFSVVAASLSFEHDYPRLAAMLAAGGIEPMADDRAPVICPAQPLVMFGGVAMFMNPEPVAPFADCILVGEAEAVLPELIPELLPLIVAQEKRQDFLKRLAARVDGCYVPSMYRMRYGSDGRLEAIEAGDGAPGRIRKQILPKTPVAPHSTILSPLAELPMYMVELGRGCSRSCRFCAAGFIYRPPRLWHENAVLGSIDARPDGAGKIGLLGMEMAPENTLDLLIDRLEDQQCTLSFSSLRADRISDSLVSLLAMSRLKSVALAPDGASERLRRLINKNLCEQDLLDSALRLARAGIVHLKFYVMIGLPTETNEDLDELASMLRRLRHLLLPLARQRGQMVEITLSVNSFVPKPWTPFQYLSFGGLPEAEARTDLDVAASLLALKQKIRYLRSMVKGIPNIHLRADRARYVLEQAVFARGDRRLAPVLLDMGLGRFGFRQAMRRHGLSAWEYAIRPREADELFCWEIIDHGLDSAYLHRELQRAMKGKKTPACDTGRCRRCGVCSDAAS